MKQLRSLAGLIFVVVCVYTTWKVLPSYMANYELEQTIDNAARFGAMDPRKSEEELRANILHQAEELHVELQPNQVHVQRIVNDVLIWSDYTVHVDVPIYPFDLHFQPMSKSKKRTM